MYSLNDLLEIANPIRAFGKTYNVTSHPDEVLQILSQDQGRFIRAYAYNTVNRAILAPVLVNFHGSRFVNPLHGMTTSPANTSKQIPRPASVNDAENAVRWVLSHPEKFDASRLSISGFSAGGLLSLALSSVAFPQGTFKNVLTAYPPTDMTQESLEKVAPDTSIDPAPVELLDVFIQCYYPNPEDVKSFLASQAVIPAEKFSDRVFIVTTASCDRIALACDRFCLEGEALGYRIRNETAKHVKMHRYDGCEHAFDKAYKKGSVQERAKDDFYERTAAFLAE
ncbi:Alpha/Beta hydrolase protein [Aspergillus pseudoustus]|uniref:Alpha/Beta hydrolase protein n=1 Tax=Aspergillus pseudoustus TaxID=1810923 RepID=A0ABR4JV35_9EURO